MTAPVQHSTPAPTSALPVRDSAGELWLQTPGNGTIYHSVDDGATWASSPLPAGVGGGSMFVDANNRAHLVYATRPSNYNLEYRTGILNATRDGWLWSSAVSFGISQAFQPLLSEVVAFPMADGRTFVAVAYSDVQYYNTSVQVLLVASDGTPSKGAGYGAGQITAKALTFAHTGDALTPSATPHLFLAGSGNPNTALGTYLQRFAYNGDGTLTAGTQRNLGGTNVGSITCDGTRVLVSWIDSAGVVKVSTRDFADTTTGTLPDAGKAGAFGTTSAKIVAHKTGDVYLYGTGYPTSNDQGANTAYLYRKTYHQGAGTWDGTYTQVSTTRCRGVNLRALTGPKADVDATIYLDGASTALLETQELNNPPNAPTLTSPANNATIDLGSVQRFAWTFSDPDAGDSQSAFDLQYWDLDGSGARVGSAHSVSQTTTNAYWDAPAGTFSAGNKEWQVRTYDAAGVQGPWSPLRFFIASNVKVHSGGSLQPAAKYVYTSGGTWQLSFPTTY